jgi:UDP-galactopyranose mutase
MPKQGYTRLFENMLEHPLISVEVDKYYFDVRETIQPKIALVYSGPVDAYFNYRFGMLGWRSLAFEWVEMEQEYAQTCVSINYPSDYEYTRSVEIKHVTGQKHPRTVLSFEYPRDEGEPYYPVPTKANLDAYARYGRLAQKETRQKSVYFCGRLATYTYLNMDQAIERALDLFGLLKGRYAHA